MNHRVIRHALLATAAMALAAGFAPGATAGGPHRDMSHAKRVLFVSNVDGNLHIYTASIHRNNPPLLGTISDGTSRPEGVWVDRKDTLYVENGPQYPKQADIEEYKRGATTPFRTITDGLYSPGAVAVGSDGTVYVNQLGEKDGGLIGVVAVYAPGETKLERTIALNAQPEYGMSAGGMAVDPQGNIYAATFGNATEVHVFRIAPGSSTATDLGLQGYGGSAIAIDGTGNLYAGGGDGFIAVYPPGATSPSRTISFATPVNGMIAARNGTLYAVTNSSVAEFAPGASTPTNYVGTDYGETLTYDAALGFQ